MLLYIQINRRRQLLSPIFNTLIGCCNKMDHLLNNDELNEYRLLINDIELKSEANTSVNYETLNYSTAHYYNSLNLFDPSNYDLQNQTESFPLVHDDDMNPCIHFDGAVLTCTLCIQNSTNFCCTTAKEIVKHLWEIHQEKLFFCNVCNEQFHHKFELSKHIKIHVPSNSNKKWECGTCTKKFGSRNLLEEHENVHAGVRPFTCDLCGKSYGTKYTYKTHQKTHEHRIRSYECEMCNNSFLTKQNLKQHQETHKEVKEFVCNLCDNRTFTTENNLKSHMIIHEENKRFLCTFNLEGQSCGKRFSRKAELRDHERIHTGERPYVCQTCGMSFTQRSNLQSHNKATHLNLKNKICHLCGKGFKRKRLLMYHINAAHTKERPHKCPECGKDFVYPEHLKKHRLNLHQNEKPFQCNICDKLFSTRDNYNSHLYKHSTRKQYECFTCGVGFTRKPVLKKHMDVAKHWGSTYVFNRVHMQFSSDGNSNTKENTWKVITVSEIKEMNEVTYDDAQTIPVDGILYENDEYANQYYLNEAHTIVQNPDGSQYFGMTENGEITQYGYENYTPQLSMEGYPNEYVNNDQNNFQQIEMLEGNEVKYIFMEIVPDQQN